MAILVHALWALGKNTHYALVTWRVLYMSIGSFWLIMFFYTLSDFLFRCSISVKKEIQLSNYNCEFTYLSSNFISWCFIYFLTLSFGEYSFRIPSLPCVLALLSLSSLMFTWYIFFLPFTSTYLYLYI